MVVLLPLNEISDILVAVKNEFNARKNRWHKECNGLLAYLPMGLSHLLFEEPGRYNLRQRSWSTYVSLSIDFLSSSTSSWQMLKYEELLLCDIEW